MERSMDGPPRSTQRDQLRWPGRRACLRDTYPRNGSCSTTRRLSSRAVTSASASPALVSPAKLVHSVGRHASAGHDASGQAYRSDERGGRAYVVSNRFPRIHGPRTPPDRSFCPAGSSAAPGAQRTAGAPLFSRAMSAYKSEVEAPPLRSPLVTAATIVLTSIAACIGGRY